MAEKQYEPQKKIEPIDGLDAMRQVHQAHLDQIQGNNAVDPSAASEAASKIKFDEALEKVDPSKMPSRVQQIADASSEVNSKPNPMEIFRAQNTMSTQSVPTIESIKNQALELRSAFETPRATLMGFPMGPPELSSQSLSSMGSYIEHADSALKEATGSVRGVEVGSLIQHDKPPMEKFLNFLTDGDKQVSTIIDDIAKLDLNGQKLTPQLLLAVQVKLGFVQQELEFFTNVLNRALESTKTIMNVQI